MTADPPNKLGAADVFCPVVLLKSKEKSGTHNLAPRASVRKRFEVA